MSNKIYYSNVAVGAKEEAYKAINASPYGYNRYTSATNSNVYHEDIVYMREQLKSILSPGTSEVDYEDFNYKMTSPISGTVINDIDIESIKKFSRAPDTLGVISSEVSSSTEVNGLYEYTNPLTLTFNMNKNTYISNGISIKFKDFAPGKVHITYKYITTSGSAVVISDKDYTDIDSLIYFFDNGEEIKTYDGYGYNQVIVTFLSAIHPKCSTKVLNVEFGRVIEIADFISLNTNQQICIDGSDLPIGGIEFECFIDGSVYQAEGQTLDFYHNGEYVNRYYLETCDRTSEKTYSFVANDVLHILDNYYCNTAFLSDTVENDIIRRLGLYNYVESGLEVNGTDVVEKISEKTGVSISPIPNLIDDQICGIVDYTKTFRYLLLQVYFHFGLYGYAEKGEIRNGWVPTSSDIPASIINSDRILGNSTVKKTVPISSVKFDRKSPTGTGDGSDLGDDSVIYNGTGTGSVITVNTDNFTIYLDGTGFNNQASTTKTRGYQASFYVANGTQAKVNGYTMCVNSNMQTAVVHSGVSENVKVYDKYPITCIPNMSYDFASGLAYVNKSIRTVSATIVLQNEKIGDYVTIETAYDGTFSGFITKMDITYSNNSRIGDVEIYVI